MQDFPRESKQKLEVNKDWSKSRIYQLVLDLMSLPPVNRLETAKELELHFCNPAKLQIFTEDESTYNFSLLRKRDQHSSEPYDEEILGELFSKAKRTVEVLSEHLLLTAGTEDHDAIDQVQADKENPAAGPANSIILMHQVYKKVTINSVIKLLLRCKKLYGCLYEVKKLLKLIAK